MAYRENNRPRRERRDRFAKPSKRPSVSKAPRPALERPTPPDDICWGRQPVLDLVKGNPTRCTRLLIANNVRPPFLDELTDAARAGRVVYQMVAPEALDKLCPGERHQGVACRITETKPVELEPFLRALPKDRPALIVVLDHIEDPHNMGAIVRSAEAAGAAAVVYSRRRSALPGGTVVKTSAGAALRLPMIPVVNIVRTIEQLQALDFWTAGLEGRAEASLWEESLPARLALVVGAEGEGLSRLVSQTCDQLLRIPIQGGVGSLNASVAAALGIFEWRRGHEK
ncbi:MAG: 23S rRNA (guanosine(2251)-2'-O)-methyltransferase RlmB [Fretibacterium sp.]|nr:23S rRNA (guanosine(2251)-2'-O)-methyltransferase RlmB [Fretibacterium sp.]